MNFTSARLNNKLIFIELQPSAQNNVNWEIFKKYSAFNNKETAAFLNHNFNCFSSVVGDSLTSFLFKKQIPKIIPAYYIFDADSNFLCGSFGRDKSIKDFVLLRDSALLREKGFKRLLIYKDKLAKNAITKRELRSFIELKLQLKQYDNGELIEKFAAEMNEADAENPEILLLIMQAGPFYNSLASKKAVANKELYNTIYKKEYYNYFPRFEKRSLNNSIVYATATRNFTMIQNVARSYQYRYNKSDYATEVYSPWVMMGYYRSIKDTLNYMTYLCKYHDKYLLVSPDSSKNYDAKLAEKTRNDRLKSGKKESIIVVTNKDYFANRLSYAIGQIIKYQSKNPFYLNKGINYCQHALLLAPNFYVIKAKLAYLLYLSGFYAEAEKVQQDAINTPKIPENTKAKYVNDLEKIRQRNME